MPSRFRLNPPGLPSLDTSPDFTLINQIRSTRELEDERQARAQDRQLSRNIALSEHAMNRNLAQRKFASDRADETFSRQMEIVKLEQDQAKFAVGKLTDAYNQASSGAMREAIVRTMKEYQTTLPPIIGEALAPYIAHGPISLMAEKEREFDKIYPAPPLPIAEAGENFDPITYSETFFAHSDWTDLRKHFVTGIKAEPTNILPLPDGAYAIRKGPGQRPTILSKDDIALQDLEEKTGVPRRDLIANKGWHKTDQEIAVNINGLVYKKTKHSNYFTGEERWDTTGFDRMPQPPEIPSRIQDAMVDGLNDKPTTPAGKGLRKLLYDDKDPAAATEYLNQLGNGQYIFKIDKSETPGKVFGTFWTNKHWRITPIPAQQGLREFVDSSGGKHRFAVADGDKVFNGDGVFLGSVQDVERHLAQPKAQAQGAAKQLEPAAPKPAPAPAESPNTITPKEQEKLQRIATKIKPTIGDQGNIIDTDMTAINELVQFLANKAETINQAIYRSLGITKDSALYQLILAMIKQQQETIAAETKRLQSRGAQ